MNNRISVFADGIENKTVRPEQIPEYERQAVQEELLRRWMDRGRAERNDRKRRHREVA